MKHTVRITLLLLCMFFVAQIVGVYVAHVYRPVVVQEFNQTTNSLENKTTYNVPYGLTEAQSEKPSWLVVLPQILVALVIAVVLMFTLMHFRAETFLRVWFFAVVTIGIAVTINAFTHSLFSYASLISLIIALPLAYMKIFKRNLLVHNLTEVLIYPGIASVFIPLLNVGAALGLLVLISLYDMYAVWHAGFMQKMAKYQIEQLKLFSGFFVPYIGKKESQLLKDARIKKDKGKKVGVHIAILGGGDVVFPIILAGVVLHTLGLIPALAVSIGATLALALLFYFSEKGKFYPAMPFISAGCFIGLGLAYLIA